MSGKSEKPTSCCAEVVKLRAEIERMRRKQYNNQREAVYKYLDLWSRSFGSGGTRLFQGVRFDDLDSKHLSLLCHYLGSLDLMKGGDANE